MYFYIVYGGARRRYGGAGRNSLQDIPTCSPLQKKYRSDWTFEFFRPEQKYKVTRLPLQSVLIFIYFYYVILFACVEYE